MKRNLINQNNYNDRHRGESNWVQLEQYPLRNNTGFQYQTNYSSQNNHPYQKLGNEAIFANNGYIPQSNPYFNQHNGQKSHKYQYPEQIAINGNTYRIGLQTKKSQKKSKIPQMLVKCIKCQTDQMVPGTAQQFKCGCCRNIQGCCPTYKLLICGYCRSKVLYPNNGSQNIKCTKCSSINKLEREQLYLTPGYKRQSELRFQRNSQISYDDLINQQDEKYPYFKV